MYILGLSCFYHDASAALLKDGKIVASAEEERFSRKKHDTAFPIKAINFCLDSEKISINDIDYVGFYEKPFLKFERMLSQHLESFPLSMKTFVSSLPSWMNEKLYFNIDPHWTARGHELAAETIYSYIRENEKFY